MREAESKRPTRGAGESGLLVSLLGLEDRAEREAEREEKRAQRESDDAEDRAVSSWFDQVQAVADAAMIAAEFHKHKRQWRRKRR